MEKVINLLEKQIIDCTSNYSVIEKNLSLLNHATADQSEKQRLELMATNIKDFESQCFEALKILKQ